MAAERFVDVLTRCAESSSLHGFPKIVSSKQLVVKALWCLLLLGALALCSYQCYEVFSEYYQYPVQTTVSLQHEKLPFPAITICNMNPFKLSRSMDDNKLRELLYGNASQNSQNTTDSDLANKALDMIFDEVYEDTDFSNLANSTTPAATVNAFSLWQDQVMARFRELPNDTRISMGHDISILLHSAQYAGYTDSEYNFNLKPSPVYGNCYTWSGSENKAIQTGPRHGLRLVLNLESSEYMSHFSGGSGVRLVVHERNTEPHPEEDGITLSPAYETNVALKMTRYHRLGSPYGNCSDEMNANGMTRTYHDCFKQCSDEFVFYNCYCTPFTALHDNIERICSTISDIECVRNVPDPPCECPSRCYEEQYTTVVSGRKWPSIPFLENAVMKESCSRNMSSMDSLCEELKNASHVTESNYMQFASNFLAVNIYFEKLSYQVFEEKPAYTTVNLLSNIGGTMGFYMGASVLTYVELLHFLLEVGLYIKHSKKRTTGVHQMPDCNKVTLRNKRTR